MARPDLETVQKLLEHPVRLAILAGLSGRAMLTIRDLATKTSIRPETLRHHLTRLRDAEVVITEVHDGKHQHRLADAAIAKALKPLRVAAKPRETAGVLCGQHLGGELGDTMTSAMLARGHLERRGASLVLTERGQRLFATIGLDQEMASGSTSRICRSGGLEHGHLGGKPGKALLRHLLGLGWITLEEDRHCIAFTVKGRTALSNLFGIRV
jgi:DNA-binding transcriptional ArsR family regulator